MKNGEVDRWNEQKREKEKVYFKNMFSEGKKN